MMTTRLTISLHPRKIYGAAADGKGIFSKLAGDPTPLPGGEPQTAQFCGRFHRDDPKCALCGAMASGRTCPHVAKLSATRGHNEAGRGSIRGRRI
jgi:hypothetical protein